MYTKLNASRSYVYAVARACDKGRISRRVSLLHVELVGCMQLTDVLQDCAGAILYSTEKAIEVCIEAQQCFGGNGYINGELQAQPLLMKLSSTDILFQTTPSVA